MTAKVTKDGKPAVGETVKFTASSLNNVGPLSGITSEVTDGKGQVTKAMSPVLTDKYVKGSLNVAVTTQGKTATTSVEITPEKLEDKLDLTLSATDVKTDELVTGEVKLTNQKGPLSGRDVKLTINRTGVRIENMDIIKLDTVTDTSGVLRFEVDPDIPYDEPSSTPIQYTITATYGTATPVTETVTVTRPVRPKKGTVSTDITEITDGGEVPFTIKVMAENEGGDPTPAAGVRVRVMNQKRENVLRTGTYSSLTDSKGEVSGTINVSLEDPSKPGSFSLHCYGDIPSSTDTKVINVNVKGA